MRDAKMLKLMIAGAGITGLAIRFDIDRRLIIARFMYGGAVYRREIPFAEIEEVFTEGPIQARTQPLSDERDGAG